MGYGPCYVHAPSTRAEPGNIYYSEVVELRRDFMRVGHADRTYAIILPSFGSTPPVLHARDSRFPDLTYFTPDRVAPDFHDRMVWLRHPCRR